MRSVVCWITLLVASATAHAQPPPSPPATDVTEADRLFQEGRTLAKEKKYAEACERFARSYQLDPTVGTELNLADCHEQLGDLREAWRLFVHAADESARTDDDKRTTFARGRADAIAARLATVVIKLPRPTPAGLTVTIGGRDVPVPPTGELRDLVAPGKVDVVAKVPDHPGFVSAVDAAAGATVTVEVPPFVTTPIIPATTEPRRDRGRVRLAWGLAGGGGVTALVAAVLTLKARNDYNTAADGPRCDRVSGGIVCDDAGAADIASAQRLADIGTVFAVSAGLLFAASATVYFTAPREPLTVTPTATGDSLGVSVTGSF